jgi:MoxR-like ATPase
VSAIDLTPADVRTRADDLLAELERAVIGKRDILVLVLLGVLADGHILIEDVPGVAKTLIARSFATATGAAFSRIQFTPDLLPADVTGSSFFDQRTRDFEFRPGPVFTNVLLADEVNRAPPKTQAALLEAMQEHQVTSDDETRSLPVPFVVLATQNPIEFEGTYPLPEAQLDRFLMRLRVGYPAADAEWEMLQRRSERVAPEPDLEQVLSLDELSAMQAAIHGVHVEQDVGRYIVAIIATTRASKAVQLGASPRGGLAVMALARARALLDGRHYVVPDDVKAVAVPALAHRLSLRPELWVQEVSTEDIVRRCLDEVPTPPTRPQEPDR